MRSAAAAQPRQFVRGAAVTAVLLGYAIHLGTLAHPFLLADNRHVLGLGPLRQGAQPVYSLVSVCMVSVWHTLVGECMDGERTDVAPAPGPTHWYVRVFRHALQQRPCSFFRLAFLKHAGHASQHAGHDMSCPCLRQALHVLHMEGRHQRALCRTLYPSASIRVRGLVAARGAGRGAGAAAVGGRARRVHRGGARALAPGGAAVRRPPEETRVFRRSFGPLLWAAGLTVCTAVVLVPSPLAELRCASIWGLGFCCRSFGARPRLWAAGLAACTAAVLVPLPLMELRCASIWGLGSCCRSFGAGAAAAVGRRLAACTAAVLVPLPLVELRCAAHRVLVSRVF